MLNRPAQLRARLTIGRAVCGSASGNLAELEVGAAVVPGVAPGRQATLHDMPLSTDTRL